LSFTGTCCFSDDVTLVSAELFNSYTNDFQQEAWNLPTIKLNSNIDFNITQSGLPVRLFLGERKDYQMNSDIIYIVVLVKIQQS
jgi:hypothetical protein